MKITIYGWSTRLLEKAGRIDEAIGWYQRAAEAGNRSALGWAAGLLDRAGRIDEGIGWFLRAAEAGDPFALLEATELLERVGRIGEAQQLRQYGLEPGGRIAHEWH
jgi:TPR repeat protein